MRLLTSGFELNSKTSGIEFDNSSIPGSLALVTSPSNGGAYSLKVAPVSQATYAIYIPYTANQNTGCFVRVWINIASSTVNATRIIAIYNSSTVFRGGIVLTPSNQLQLLNSSGTQIGVNSAALTAGSWYCIELAVDLSVGSGVMIGRINGSQFASGAGNSPAGWSKVYFGCMSSTTMTMYMDDIAVNDSTGAYQNSFPGLGYVLRGTPNAAGDSNTFATNVGGTSGAANNFTRVNQLTPDGLTTYNASAAAGSSDLFPISLDTIPPGSVINCVTIGAQFADLTTADATAALKVQVEKITGGTKAQSSAIIPNSTTMSVNAAGLGGSASNFPLTLYNDPDGLPWTPASVAAMQIGYVLATAGTSSIAVSDVWALVEWSTPPPVSTATGGSTLATLGVG